MFAVCEMLHVKQIKRKREGSKIKNWGEIKDLLYQI